MLSPAIRLRPHGPGVTVGPDHTSLDSLPQRNGLIVALAVHCRSQPVLGAIDFLDDVLQVRPTSVWDDRAELLFCDKAAVGGRVNDNCRIEEVPLIRSAMKAAVHFPAIDSLRLSCRIAVPAIQNDVVAVCLAFLLETLETAEQVNVLDGANVGARVVARADDGLPGSGEKGLQKAFVDVGVHVDSFGGNARLPRDEPCRQGDLLGHPFDVLHVRADDHRVIAGAVNL